MDKTFDIDDRYDSNGMLNECGLYLLDDMHATLINKGWDRAEAIAYVAGNHRCHKEKATAMIDWALEIFKRENGRIAEVEATL